MNAAAEDHWTEVLAGRAAPQDADARRAARARAWFEAQARTDLAAPADEAAIGRLLVRLEGVAAGARPAIAAGPRAGAPYDGVSEHPAEGGHAALAVSDARATSAGPTPASASAGWTWLRMVSSAWFAPRPLTAFAAALFAGVLLLQWQAVPEDDSQVKTTGPAAGGSPPDGRGHTLIARSAAPLQDAIALRDELLALGLAAQVLELGNATRLQANVDAGLQAAVQQKLNQRGWAWTPGPELSVEFQRAP